MNTGYFEYGVIVTERRRIMRNYFKTKFWSDFLPIIGVICTEKLIIILALLQFLRIYQI